MLKKVIILVVFFIVVAILGLWYVGYFDSNDEEAPEVTTVEQLMASDSLKMDSIFKEQAVSVNPDTIECKYVHFETCIELQNEVDTILSPIVARLVDVYQITKTNRITGDTNTDVYRIIHDVDGKIYIDITENGFWLEDNPINDSEVKVTFTQAYNNLQKANCVKPHSHFVTLRNAIGPHPCNTQWIFGNASNGVVFVDAVTGEVNLQNPVYVVSK